MTGDAIQTSGGLIHIWKLEKIGLRLPNSSVLTDVILGQSCLGELWGSAANLGTFST